MLTAKGEEDNKVQGLKSALMTISPSLFTRELVARLKAVLRRTDNHKMLNYCGWRLCLDPISHRVTIGDSPVQMGPTEYRLLEFFLTHQERVYTRSQLLDHVWGGNVYVEDANCRRAYPPSTQSANTGRSRPLHPNCTRNRLPILHQGDGGQLSRRLLVVTSSLLHFRLLTPIT